MINREIGLLLILFGFFCYFIACRIWIEGDNYFRLVSDNKKRQQRTHLFSLSFAFLGFMLSSWGLFETNTIYHFSEDDTTFQSFIEKIMFFFYHSLFIWFNILITRKYFYKNSICGKWIGNNYEIIFHYYINDNIREIDNYGNGELKQKQSGHSDIYNFHYTINYKKMTINITWLGDYSKKKDIPPLVYFGNSNYKYKMKSNNTLFLDSSIGYMKRKF